jgi:hypothetical protein
MKQEGGKTGRFLDCSERVIGACIEVNRAVGPGLLESAYTQLLAHELCLRDLRFECQKASAGLESDLRINFHTPPQILPAFPPSCFMTLPAREALQAAQKPS